MKMRIFTIVLVYLFSQLPLSVAAEELLMVRARVPFPEAMLVLQDSIRDHGYTLTRVQRVDIGLTGMGYETDKYRLVFFGKADEIRMLTAKVPELTPYLPAKIAIFAEEDQTLLVTASPKLYAGVAGNQVDPVVFDRWESDLRSIFHDVSVAE